MFKPDRSRHANDTSITPEERAALVRRLTAQYHRLRDEANAQERREIADYVATRQDTIHELFSDRD